MVAFDAFDIASNNYGFRACVCGPFFHAVGEGTSDTMTAKIF